MTATRIAFVGAAFAVAVLLGLALGIAGAQRSGKPSLVLLGLLAGFLIGIYVALKAFRAAERLTPLPSYGAPYAEWDDAEPAIATKTEEGSLTDDPKPNGADASEGLRAYFARKRTVSVRALILILPVAAIVAVRAPMFGFDLFVGCACGIGNMLATMRANERLLTNGGSVRGYMAQSVVRVLAVGAVPVMLAVHGPWWSMGLYFAGFFTPLGLYAAVAQRSHS
jgi:hypothetical protein